MAGTFLTAYNCGAVVAFAVILKESVLRSGIIRRFSVLVFTSSFASSLTAQSLIEQELERRRDSVIAAEEALIAGDEAYESSDFKEAVVKYRKAFSLTPKGSKTEKFRDGARERYAQAAVEAAKVMNRQGNRAGAILMVNEVLGEEVFPDYFPAQKLRARLDDPITVNPVVTTEHAQNVDEVRRLLYQAEGFYNLGDFDNSVATYQKVLRIDSYNVAARRGLERNSAQISDYANSARDQARAELLTEVDAGWELRVPPKLSNIGPGVIGEELVTFSGASLDDKLDNIIFPLVSIDEFSLEEAIEYLVGQTRNLDPEVIDSQKGVDFVLNLSARNSPEIQAILQTRFSLRLNNVPVRQILDYVTRQTGTSYRVDRHAVVIQPANGLTNDLLVRKYEVPPDFLNQTPVSSGVEEDPFGSGGDDKNTLAPRLTAREVLEKNGVPFPEGASASYNSSLGQLVVKTTDSGHGLVRSIVDSVNLKEPFAVMIETKIVRITQENLEELNFDVGIQNFAGNGDVFLDGGTLGNGEPSAFGLNPLTSGVRSGDFASFGDSLDELLASESVSETAIANPESAPGFLSLIGIVDDTALGVLLRGLNQQKGTDLVSQPSVITRSGQQAIIEAGQEFIYPTEYEPPELPNNIGVTSVVNVAGGAAANPVSFIATPSHPTAFETRFVGTTLEVQPTVSADRKIAELSFNLEMDEFLGFIDYGTPILGGGSQAGLGIGGLIGASQSGEITSNNILVPIFETLRLNTNLSVATGQTIIAGGLLSETVSVVDDQVPILGSIPLLGRLFTSDSVRRDKSVLMVFVTVRIVDPGGNPVQN